MSTKEQLCRSVRSFLEDDECCLICERPMRGLPMLFGLRHDVVCPTCRNEWMGALREQCIDHFHVTYCYLYSEVLGDCFFRFKGVGDIRLAEMFLFPYVKQLRKKFGDCILVRMPSWHEDDASRGFNHVHEIFSYLGLPICCPFVKKKNEKQSQKHKMERAKTESLLGLDEGFDRLLLRGKRLILVDDVMTTGNTLRRASELLDMEEVEVMVIALHERLSKKDEEKRVEKRRRKMIVR